MWNRFDRPNGLFFLDGAFPQQKRYGGGARDINTDNYAVGEYNEYDFTHAFLWQGQKASDLTNFIGLNDDSSGATAINDEGLIGGYGRSYGGFLWSRGAGLVPLGQFIPSGINRHGQAVGNVGGQPAQWDKFNGVRNLELLPGGVSSVASRINANGQIVGAVMLSDGATRRAVIWDYSGRVKDLNSFVPANSGWVLVAANGINDKGEIVGEGIYNGVTSAFLLTPDPQVFPQFFPPTHGTDLDCNATTIDRPAPRSVINAHGWSMDVEVSDKDGLVLRNIKLKHRYMAERISIPYFTLETNQFAKMRGELMPNGSRVDGTLRSRLVGYNIVDDGTKLTVEASYVIDQLPNGSQSCLNITQRYEFYDATTGCEPSGKLPCSPFKPIMDYKFNGQNGERLNNINIVQRDHFVVGGASGNAGAVFKDCDFDPVYCVFDLSGFIFSGKINPLTAEYAVPVISKGLEVINPTRTFDNYHRTFSDSVSEPGVPDNYNPFNPGCPECVHVHWHWGRFIATRPGNENYGGGTPLIPPGSYQDVSIAVTRNHEGEEHPENYALLINDEPLQIVPTILIGRAKPEPTLYDLVFWYSATGYDPKDSFYTHGGFFNPSAADIITSFSAGSVKAADTYQDGQMTMTNFDPNAEVPLPAGYAAYNPPIIPVYDGTKERDDEGAAQRKRNARNVMRLTLSESAKAKNSSRALREAGSSIKGAAIKDVAASNPLSFAFDIETAAVTSGPYKLTFFVNRYDINVASPNQSDYDKLRVLHLENGVWVDRTVAAPDPFAPSYADGVLLAQANSLGKFIVAVKSDQPPPNNRAPIVRTKNITVASDNSCGATIKPSDVDAGTSDPDAGDTFTLNVSPTNLSGIGAHTVTLTAVDNHGASSSATAVVTVADQTPPTIIAPPSITIGTGAGATSCGVVITDAILGSASASDNCSGVSVARSGVPAGNLFPVGVTTITYTATDASGNTAFATQIVTVSDTTPPTISNLSVDKATLSPPNHKMIPVTVSYNVADNCDAAAAIKLSLSVTSNEAVNGSGDGNTSADWQVIDAHHVLLRAERAGNGNGRIYTITVTATDRKAIRRREACRSACPISARCT